MKVNLSYSVEIDEVLPSVERLYLENKGKFETNYNLLTAVSKLEFTNPKLETTLRNLREAHHSVVEFAGKLEEINNILMGYRSVLDQGEEEELPPVREEISVPEVTVPAPENIGG